MDMSNHMEKYSLSIGKDKWPGFDELFLALKETVLDLEAVTEEAELRADRARRTLESFERLIASRCEE
jgi:hypothetical protein